MKTETGRQVVSFHLTLDPGVEGIASILDQVAGLMIQRVQSGEDLVEIEGKTMIFGFIDAEIRKSGNGMDCLCLLALCADKEGADPAWFNTTDGSLRSLLKGANEANATTAHLVIALRPAQVNGRRHAGILEVATNVGRTRVRAGFNRTLKAAARLGELVAEDKRTGKRVPLKPTTTMELVASDKIKQQARGGQIKSIILYDRNVDNEGLDPPIGVIPKRRQMTLKVDLPRGEQIVDFLNRLKPWATAKGFDDMYVAWEHSDEEQGDSVAESPKSESARIDLRLEDVGEMAFARRRYVQLDEKLPEAQSELHDGLLRKMLSLIDSE